MKLSDFIVQFLVNKGVTHVFVVSGGAIVHTLDSVDRHPQMDYVCVQHEQAAGAAADGYSRLSGKMGTAMVTSGPGATNLTTSICNAYFDSIPCLFICGQVTTPRLRSHKNIRQKGFQETDVVSLFQSITNYAQRLMDPRKIQYELEKSFYKARHGRPGPVVLDIPDDLQRADIDVTTLEHFDPIEELYCENVLVACEQLSQLLQKANRPIFVLGAGVRNSGYTEQLLRFARALNIPCLLTWGGKDLLDVQDPLNFGGLGVVGPRSGNFAVQTADVVIGLGTRFSQMITGGKTNLFAPKAKKVLIDVDPHELVKFTAHDFSLDLPIQATIPVFLETMKTVLKPLPNWDQWHQTIRQWERAYPVFSNRKYDQKEYVDGHVLVKELSKKSRPTDVFVLDTGANLAWAMQCLEVKQGQRVFSAWNHTPMGYALSAAVGAAIADSTRRIICITGDGGLMMNIQELATICRYNLNIKVFVFNNQGHAIQKQTMDTWLNSRYVAADEKTGLYFPDFMKTAEAFGLPAIKIENHERLDLVQQVLDRAGPIVCDVMIDPEQKIEPMLKFGAGLEDLNPKLSQEEIDDILAVSESCSAGVIL